MHEPALWEEFDEIDVADVVVDVEAPDLQPTYSYRVPPELRTLTVGECVQVPFGGRDVLGYVLERRRLAGVDPLISRLKDVADRVEGAITFSQEQATLARWIADKNVSDLTDAVRCVAPAIFGAKVERTARLIDPAIEPEQVGKSMDQAHIVATLKRLGGDAEVEELRKAAGLSSFTGSFAALVRKGIVSQSRAIARPRTTGRTVRAYALGPAADALGGRMTEAGARILAALAEFENQGESPVLAERLLTAARATAGPLKTLVDKGAVVVREVAQRRQAAPIPALRTLPPALTPGQQGAVEWIGRALSMGSKGSMGSTADTSLTPHTSHTSRTPPTALLFGVTASGKTEVYLAAIERALAAGKSAIVLVPEIALTTQVVGIFTGRFGDEVAVLHSALGQGERYDEWRRLQDSKARIVVGARSAIFAPVPNLGLVVVDEEHEASYKQENQPRYNARDVALERARLSGAVVLLGSATPSLETYYASEQRRIARLEMPERIDNRPLPAVHLVDLREEMKEHRSLFSRHLIEQMGERLARKQQTILFLNRRGYSQFVLCRDCGYVARCPNCAVSLTFHAAYRRLKCHHCDYGRAAPDVCPQCGGTKIRGFGVGTERVEEEVVNYFPGARIARLDRDTTARKGAHAAILRQVREGEADILIGTQMVAKGLDFPNVTLVGVISADTSINMPDFRAAERTFQLLTQVAGRAGRGTTPGEVVIQTFNPEHYALERAVHQDYRGFYAKEIAFRKELNYPPFSRFANLLCTGDDSAEAKDRAHGLAAELKRVLPPEVEIIGPASAPLGKLKGVYRWHVVLRAPVDEPLSAPIRAAIAQLAPSDRRRITVDVDPLSMA